MVMTHEQLDEQFIKDGTFPREDINRMQGEFQNSLSDLLNTETRADIFLKRRMGRLQYFFWKLSPGNLFITLGQNNKIEKAKHYGFKTRW